MVDIFKFQDYQSFLISCTAPHAEPRFSKAEMARAAGCQPSYFSQVLKEKVHLTEDQVMGMADFLKLSGVETDYFFLLLRKAKAGTSKLKTHLENQMKRIQKTHLDIKSYVSADQTLSEDQILSRYTQSWHYSAVHILTSGSDMTEQKIAQSVGLDIARTRQILDELTEMKFVIKQGAIWKYISGAVHVPADSPWNLPFQLARRSLVQTSLNSQLFPQNTHFSSFFMIEKKDFIQLQSMITRWVSQSHRLIHSSNSDELACLCIDLFKI